MKQISNPCECIEKLMKLRKVEEYFPPYNMINTAFDEVEEGMLCLVNTNAYDNGTWDDNFNWVSYIDITRELIPIEYCPICGKKLEYKKTKSLTKKK